MAVLVGAGTCLDAGLEPVDLMARAAVAAAGDAGVPALLERVQRIAIPQGTWTYRDPARLVADRIGADRSTTVLVEIGVPQQSLVSDALRRIDGREIDVALVVGGEGRRSALPETEQPDGTRPDELVSRTGEILGSAEVAVRLWNAVAQYALIECALRRRDGQGLDEHRDELANGWAKWNEVARRNPEAAFPEPRDAAFLRDPAPENRPLAFPYNKWHSTQWTVDQAGALLLCSEDTARAAGVDEDRWLHPLVALESSFALPLSKRAQIEEWPAMRALGRAAAHHLDRPLDSIEEVELYSCFPSATRVQQRELGLPLGGPPPTLTGGMAFAGGPFNNFTYQATAAVTRRLREERGTLGMVTTVSGFLTKPGLMVWSTDRPARPALIADLASVAEAATASRDVAGDNGPAEVIAYTVTYEGDQPARLIAVGSTLDRRRVVKAIDDPQLARDATTSDLLGATL